MVTTSGFSHTPVTRLLLLSLIAASLLTSILSLKHWAPIKPHPHLYPYLQFPRLLSFQAAYTSSTELLFAAALLYQFRALERLWGSRKFASFVLVTLALHVLLVPGAALVLKILTLGRYNFIPAGATGLVYACLAAWGEEVPRLYRWKIVTGGDGVETHGGTNTGANTSTNTGTNTRSHSHSHSHAPGVTLSDKSTTYLLAAQLALAQFPYQLLPALAGWMVGTAWVGEMLPGGLARWRVPRWMVGESARGKERGRGQFDSLRRRLEEEGGSADGMRNVSDRVAERGGGGDGGERAGGASRGFGSMISGYFTGREG